jgi:hypothetical protein
MYAPVDAEIVETSSFGDRERIFTAHHDELSLSAAIRKVKIQFSTSQEEMLIEMKDDFDYVCFRSCIYEELVVVENSEMMNNLDSLVLDEEKEFWTSLFFESINN